MLQKLTLLSILAASAFVLPTAPHASAQEIQPLPQSAPDLGAHLQNKKGGYIVTLNDMNTKKELISFFVYPGAVTDAELNGQDYAYMNVETTPKDKEGHSQTVLTPQTVRLGTHVLASISEPKNGKKLLNVDWSNIALDSVYSYSDENLGRYVSTPVFHALKGRFTVLLPFTPGPHNVGGITYTIKQT